MRSREAERFCDEIDGRLTGHDELASHFRKCYLNTLETTIHPEDDGTTFIITGDIPAMWLRDSSCQMRPYLYQASYDGELAGVISGLVRRQMRCITADPYANAFNEGPSGKCYTNDRTDMKPFLWERKFELDSISFPFQLAYLLWKNCGITEQFDDTYVQAVKTVLGVMKTEQSHESESDYRFERIMPDCPYTETLSREGRGALVREHTGLVWSGFRPSDDACRYGYLIPSNMLAAVILDETAEVMEKIIKDDTTAGQARKLAGEIREGISRYGILPGRDCYAYETDGFGEYNIMDDANLPSLLSMPWFGGCSSEDPLYISTRSMVLSEENPYFYSGRYLNGIGSPHTPINYVWDISLAMQAFTTDDRDEKLKFLTLMCENDAGTGMMHEGIDVNDPAKYTRPWFSWANAVFCEAVMDYCGYSIRK